MNKEDIIKLAIEHTIHGLKFDEDGLVRFAKLVAQHEREGCIEACEQVTADLKKYAPAFEGITAEIKFVRNIGGILGEPFIDAIQARGQA
jgi:molybdopterin synthase catalytic subunit